MEKNRRLDEGALRRLLEREQTGPEALVLRLAWLEGLTREEIAALTWDQVSFLDDRLELPDRMIPLDGEVRSVLWRLHEAKEAREGPGDPHVLLSAREHKPMRLESISRLARQALDRGGMKDVRLLDLRYDWIIRCLDQMDWPEVARISGVEVATLQLRFSASAPARKAPKPGLPLWLRPGSGSKYRRRRGARWTSSSCGRCSRRNGTRRRAWPCGWAGSWASRPRR